MELLSRFAADAINLDLAATSKEELLGAMVALLHVDEESSEVLRRMLQRREQLGSTGVGRGIAIPHCRSLVVPQLRMAYGRIPAGLGYDAIDGKPVHHVFLIVAPPVEVSNDYLPVLGRLAQFAKDPEVPERLAALTTSAEFLALLKEKGA
jgi:mannitol/fructose-specific phosphotransferase system IIA component (Ntr-type)